MEGGWVQKRFYDIGWSDERKCRGCNGAEGTEKHRHHCPCWKEVRDLIPEKLGTWEQKANTSKKGWKWHSRITSYPLSEGEWNNNHLMVRLWESEKRKSWCVPIEGFRNRVTTDGSLLGVSGKWARVAGQWCSWTTTRSWGRCTGCAERLMQSLRYSAPSREHS